MAGRAGVGLGLGALQYAMLLVAIPQLWNWGFWTAIFVYLGFYPPGMILGAWTLLALAGAWQTPGRGIDWLGRLVGWGWLVSSWGSVLVQALH